MERLSKENLLFPDALPSCMECTICYEILEDPVTLGLNRCQHAFCRECIATSLWARKECPVCREEVWWRTSRWGEDLPSHLFSKCFLDEILVRCPSRCGWHGRNDACRNHVAGCLAVQKTEELNQVKQQIEDNRSSHSSLTETLQAFRIEIERVEREVTENNEEHSALLEKLSSLEKELPALQKDSGQVKRPRLIDEDEAPKEKCSRWGEDGTQPVVDVGEFPNGLPEVDPHYNHHDHADSGLDDVQEDHAGVDAHDILGGQTNAEDDGHEDGNLEPDLGSMQDDDSELGSDDYVELLEADDAEDFGFGSYPTIPLPYN